MFRVGEGRACWSLGNAYVSLGDHKQALHYARKHLDISKEVSVHSKNTHKKNSSHQFKLSGIFVGDFAQIGDRNGELTAKMNVEQLMEALGVNESDLSPSSSEFEMQGKAEVFLPAPVHETITRIDVLDLLSVTETGLVPPAPLRTAEVRENR